MLYFKTISKTLFNSLEIKNNERTLECKTTSEEENTEHKSNPNHEIQPSANRSKTNQPNPAIELCKESQSDMFAQSHWPINRHLSLHTSGRSI